MLMTHLDLLLFLAIGVFSGLLSGLLGVGGGIIVVPMLLLVLKTNPLFADTNLMHIAAGTSLAAMIVTSLSSAYAYHRHNAVIWPVFWYTLPGICIGMLFGSMLTTHLNVTILSNLFSVFLILTALHLFRDNAPKPRAPTDAVQHQSTYTPKNTSATIFNATTFHTRGLGDFCTMRRCNSYRWDLGLVTIST